MNYIGPTLQPDIEAARKHVGLLTGSPDTVVSVRFIPDSDKSKPALERTDTIDRLWSDIVELQRDGYGVFIVVNEGSRGREDGFIHDIDITNVRALFVDGDDVVVPDAWHAPPDFIVRRDERHWHGYWNVSDMPVAEFKTNERRLIAYYGTDPTACNPGRVMRLAGTLHQKEPANPRLVKLDDRVGVRLPRGKDELLQGLPVLPEQPKDYKPSPLADDPITATMLRNMLAHIDPTFTGGNGTWVGIAKAIIWQQIPLTEERDEGWWENLLDDWCSGNLWRERTRDTAFAVSTYRGREELLIHLNDKPRQDGPQTTLGTIIALANAGGYTGPKDATVSAAQTFASYVPEPNASNDDDDAGYTWDAPDTGFLTDTLPPPTLPPHVFSPSWASWIEDAAEAKGAPADYLAVGLLSVASGIIGNARWITPWGDWHEPPVLNAALVGLPSSGKSPALTALTKPLLAMEKLENTDWQERQSAFEAAKLTADLRRTKWKDDTKRGMDEAYRNAVPLPAEAMTPDTPQRRRILSTDPTIEKAGVLSAGNPRGLVLLRDELAGWLGGMDRYNNASGSDRAFWLQARDGGPWAPDRVKDGNAAVSVEHLAWAIVGGIQPDRLHSMLLSGDDDGLAARFLYTWPTPARPVRPRDGLDTGRGSAWLQRLRRLPWMPPAPLLVPLDPAAREVFQAWRERVADMEADAGGLLLSWIGKLPGYALRVALVLAHLDWCAGDTDAASPHGIDATIMRRAIRFLADYAVPMAQRCFGPAAGSKAERDAYALARWVMHQKPMPAMVNAREMQRLRLLGLTGDEIKTALGELAARGLVRQTQTPPGIGGRARSDWEINPVLAGQLSPLSPMSRGKP